MYGYYIRLIKKHGKLTYARKMILDELLLITEHVSVESLRLRLKTLGIATIYRTLELFESLCIVESVKSGQKKFYKIKSPTEPFHIHVICEKCQQIEEYDYHELEHVISSLDLQFQISHIVIKGKCKKCLDEKAT